MSYRLHFWVISGFTFPRAHFLRPPDVQLRSRLGREEVALLVSIRAFRLPEVSKQVLEDIILTGGMEIKSFSWGRNYMELYLYVLLESP